MAQTLALVIVISNCEEQVSSASDKVESCYRSHVKIPSTLPLSKGLMLPQSTCPKKQLSMNAYESQFGTSLTSQCRSAQGSCISQLLLQSCCSRNDLRELCGDSGLARPVPKGAPCNSLHERQHQGCCLEHNQSTEGL